MKLHKFVRIEMTMKWVEAVLPLSRRERKKRKAKMTRIRVLLRTLKLLEKGFTNDFKRGTLDHKDNPVAFCHPKAVRYTLFTAIKRSILDLCGEDRQTLEDQIDTELVARLGSLTRSRTFFQEADQETTIAFIKDVLRSWGEEV